MSYISYHDVEKMGESEANDKSIRPGLSEMTSITSGTTLPVTQVGNTIPPFVPQDTGPEGSHSGKAPTQAGEGGVLDDTKAPEKQEVEVEEDPVLPDIPPVVIGDFDGSANPLWELYVKEAKSNDESQIQPLREDMGEVLIFAGLFSAVLTAFIVDSKQNLNVDPQDQMVYYLQQNVALLNQISKQILSIAPQVPIPSTPPPPFPSFKPLESDIRVNVFWFMALIFSLSAALLAFLIQQWVRNYMDVFQRYNDPLKCARVRQYLHDGLEQGKMHFVAGLIPGFLHLSLFLFFAGLCDLVLNRNMAVGISTTVPIALSSSLYITTTFVPMFRPASPYHNSFSNFLSAIISSIPYVYQRWRYQDSGSYGTRKPVRSNMAPARIQLAMNETPERKERDEKAIQWLIRNMTEDAEMESLMMAIPGSFNGQWALKVWKDVSKPHTEGGRVMNEFNTRVTHLMETCKNPDLFASEEQWRKRTRGGVETVSSLVRFTGARLDQFGDIVQLLGDIGVNLKVRELSSEGNDPMLVMCWTCLSLMAIQPILASDRSLHSHARLAMLSLTDDRYHTGEGQTRTSIKKTFEEALECLKKVSDAHILDEDIKEEESLRDLKTSISKLVDIYRQYDHNTDRWIQDVQRDLVKTTHRIICQLPGVEFADPDAKPAYLSPLKKSHLQASQPEEPYLGQLKESYRDPHTYSHRLERISRVDHTFQNLLVGPWNSVTFEEVINDLKNLLAPLRREVWRLEDLCDGHGLGFTVELFFLALKQLLSTSSSKESHSALLMGTFQAITSDPSKYKSPLGTQELLLDWVVDNDIVFCPTDTNPDPYPDPIIDEFLKLLAAVLKGQSGSHIEDIVQLLTKRLEGPLKPARRAFYKEALDKIKENAKAPEPLL